MSQACLVCAGPFFFTLFILFVVFFCQEALGKYYGGDQQSSQQVASVTLAQRQSECL